MYADKRWDVPAIVPTKLSPERQALLDAADHIDRYGWCQGTISSDEAVCAIGALLSVAPTHIARRAGKLLSRFSWNRVELISVWNDAPGRTKEEVTSAMRSAARI